MPASAHFSPKMPQVARDGYLLCQNAQSGYDSHWHLHDCVMLLWPSVGELRTDWLPDTMDAARPVSARLQRGMALFLPTCAQHRTRSETRGQRHGELYLSADLLGTFQPDGLVRLDGAATAMLDALTAPSLGDHSREHLVRAVVRQCATSPRVKATPARTSLVTQMLQCISQALEHDGSAPTIRQVAARLGVSARTLERHCEMEATASPVALRRSMVAAHARALMRQGHSLAQASRRLDFATSGHLSRLLKSLPE